MEKPRRKAFNQRRETVTYFFRDIDNHAEFYVRGAVSWPEEVPGYALIAGQNVETKVVHIFEQFSFFTVDNVLRPDQIIEYSGVFNFFNKGWSKYFCQKYFWHQDEKIHKRFFLEAIRLPMLEPKPMFIEAAFTDDTDANHLIFQYQAMNKMIFEADSELHHQLEQFKNDDQLKLPAVRALRNLLAGYERYPFRRHHIQEDGDLSNIY